MSQSKLEILPNEILLQCFQYLNIIDLFHSFDQLNHRFNSLIRYIPFKLNFENIPNKSQYDQFCIKMLVDQTIQNQLYSLDLSNENTCYPIHLFLSQFSLLEFSHLHLLTLRKVTKNNWKSIQSILLSIPELSSFRMINSEELSDETISQLPILQLQTLIIPFQLPETVFSNIQLSTIINLSISKLHLDDLFILLNNASNLNFLKIKQIIDPKTTMHNIRCTNNSGNNLKTLHINDFRSRVDYLIMLLERTPNLENLIILDNDDANIINAHLWKNLIISSLPHLKNFKFKFHVRDFRQSNINKGSLREFQNAFWCDEHHWYTEYILSSSSALIYTIPYPIDTFELLSDDDSYFNESINHMNTFDNVKYLTINSQDLTEYNPYYRFQHNHSYCDRSTNHINRFRNVDSLSIGFWYFSDHDGSTKISYSYLKYLKTKINLSTIKHLTLLPGSRFETPNTCILLKILRSFKQSTSLTIDTCNFESWFKDVELCKYCNKFIKKLDIPNGLLHNSNQVRDFCSTFDNVEQVKCSLNQSNILFLIKHLRKLSYIQIYLDSKDYQISEIKNEAQKLGLDITADFDNDNKPENLFVWINRN